MFLALELGRPLLLEGEAGVGKTELAKVLAATLGSRLIRLQCYEGLDVNTAVYEWNYPRQMLEIRLLEARGEIDKASAHDIFGPEFLLKRPLLQALESTDGSAPVLLIDEIDRADEEFEAYLLEILSDFQVTVPEIGTIRAAQAPRVVLTSNRTREVHDALKRRCLYHWIDYPTAAKEFEIVATRVPDAPPRLAREVVDFVHRLRAADLTKVPGRRRDPRLGGRAPVARGGGAVARRRRRDAGRRPQVRGGHPAGPRGGRPPVPRRGDRAGLSMSPEPSSALAVAPTGEVIDGRRLLAEAVGFGRALRAAGLAVDMAASIDFARALTFVDLGNKGIVRDAGAALFVRRRDDREVYDRVFAQFWRRRGRKLPKPRIEGLVPDAERDEEGDPAAADEGGEGHDATMSELATMGVQIASDSEEDGEIEGVTISPDAYSRGELLRHRDFDRMTSAELRDAERFVDLLRPRLERRRTRRFELHPHGRRVAPAGDVPPEPGHRRADRMGLAAPDPRAAPARRPVRHLGLDGAALAAAPAVRPGAVAHERGAHRVVRVRDAPDARDPADARPRPGPRPRARRRHGHRLGGRDADRGVVPGLQPPLGAADAADARAS